MDRSPYRLTVSRVRERSGRWHWHLRHDRAAMIVPHRRLECFPSEAFVQWLLAMREQIHPRYALVERLAFHDAT